MKLKLAIHPDIVALMAAEVAAGERAVTAAMREAGTGLKSAWRGQITGAGLGTRLANSIRLASFPKSGESLNAAALVWSNAPVNRGTIGICLLGGYGASADDPFERNFTGAQTLVVKRLIAEFKGRTAIRKVSGHNDYATKVCPGFNVKDFPIS